jgi:hypothetical protein
MNAHFTPTTAEDWRRRARDVCDEAGHDKGKLPCNACIEWAIGQAVAQEREACAQVGDDYAASRFASIEEQCTAAVVAKFIRERATTPPTSAQHVSPDPTTGCHGTQAGSTRSR